MKWLVVLIGLTAVAAPVPATSHTMACPIDAQLRPTSPQVLNCPRENGDPNGIRTRVAGVKGRCPRPLDDGVIWAVGAEM